MNTHPMPARLAGVALAGLLAAASAAAQQRPPSSFDLAMQTLPKPQVAAGELPRPCAAPRPRGTPGPRLRYAAPEVEARMNADNSHYVTLVTWISLHLPSRPECRNDIDLDFAVPKFQAAVGNDITGVWAMADVDKLAAALASGRQAAAEVRDGRADLKVGRPKTVVDFLPKPSGNTDHNCDAVAYRARMKTQQETARRVAQLPPHMMRSGVTGGIGREVEAEALVVAPEWAEFWQRNPVLLEWEKAHNCDRTALRNKIETWQLAMGVAPNARDPQAVESSVQWIAKARQQGAQFQASQNTLLQAEADRSGETARARAWALEALNGKTRLADVADKLPTALCTTAGSIIRCEEPVPCAAENQAVAATRGQQNYNQLVRPLDPFAAKPGSEAAAVARLQAEDALGICQRKYAYTAAASSRLVFDGQDIQSTELTFDARGLSTLRMNGSGGSADAVRTALSRRYGLPQSQQVMRVRYEAQMEGGGTGLTPSGREVLIAPQVVQVPVNYSVTRYVWSTPTALVEETTGEVLIRFGSR